MSRSEQDMMLVHMYIGMTKTILEAWTSLWQTVIVIC